jgi:hypothetical protein
VNLSDQRPVFPASAASNLFSSLETAHEQANLLSPYLPLDMPYTFIMNPDHTAGVYDITSVGGAGLGAGIIGVLIGSKVTAIAASAFQGSDLISASIGANVASIGANAFQGCSSLIGVHFRGAPPTIGATAFGDAATGFKIHYPLGVPGWTTPTWEGYPTQPE